MTRPLPGPISSRGQFGVPLWAFASAVHNNSQRMLIVTPQQLDVRRSLCVSRTHMRSTVVSLLVTLIAASAAASPFRIDPPAPDTRSFVSISVGGMWADSCVPHDPQIAVAGTTITIVLNAIVPPSQGCLTVVSKWQQTANLGLLQPGVYDVIALIDTSSGRGEFGRTRFIVRDAGPFRAFPAGAPISGGTEIRLVSDSGWGATRTVIFGDIPVQGTQMDAVTLVVTAPAHAAGTVDLRVGSSTSRQAFTFYDPADAPDPSIFEPVLFPIAFTGPGAFGSIWVTDNVMATDTGITRLDQNSASGLLLYLARGTTGSMTFSSRVRDLSRQAESAGTGIPVIRDKDWHFDNVRVIDLPSKDRGRATLRIWSDHDRPVSVSVILEFPPPCPCFVGNTVTLTRNSDRDPLFAQIDLGDDPRAVRITSLDGDPDVRLWALVTVTNNTTQQVTAIWPN